MSTNVSVSCHVGVYESLQQEVHSLAGLLLGYESNNQIMVVSRSLCVQQCEDLVQLAEDTNLLQPAGISVVGVFCNSALPATKENVEKDLEKLNTKHLQNHLKLDHVAVFHKVKEATNFEDGPFLQTSCGEVSKCTVTTTNQDLLSTLQILRLRAELPVNIQVPDSAPKVRNHIIKEFNSLIQDVQSDTSTAVFHINNSPILLRSYEEGDGCPPECSTCGDILDYITTDSDAPEYMKKRRKKGQPSKTIQVSLHFQTTGEQAFHKTPSFSPVINYFSETFRMISVMLPLDVVALVDPGVRCDRLWHVLSQGVTKQLKAMEKCLINQVTPKEIKTFDIPTVYHFQPLQSQTLLTVIYPEGQTEEHLESARKELHKMFGFPTDRPLFRKANAFVFPEEVDTRGYLRSPHIGLPPSGVVGGELSLVQGHYTYHHYMQDRFDDNKWGCAYRSLQTLISWFNLQGYSSIPIPSHRDIQQALVDVGDKEPKFLGSKQWIGSFEVSICLDHFLGVSSKILSVNQGADLAYKGRELANHFQTQGTPVMIGGGVLAHTILGVDCNHETGAVKFLILDPHYTGGEDIKVIQDKGWCGWKGPEFWDQNAHYNLCLPQRNPAI
ncbi:ufm1-specific protease 2-like [Liolophura sinensis]|uniref:ufm1-specific protease 2-like n=1 Tax=Liolophura sinensis TaxID=3198878 RepID=UPI0031582431